MYCTLLKTKSSPHDGFNVWNRTTIVLNSRVRNIHNNTIEICSVGTLYISIHLYISGLHLQTRYMYIYIALFVCLTLLASFFLLIITCTCICTSRVRNTWGLCTLDVHVANPSSRGFESRPRQLIYFLWKSQAALGVCIYQALSLHVSHMHDIHVPSFPSYQTYMLVTCMTCIYLLPHHTRRIC